jgi:polyvinyl alcohol dehydrogenase (cytochrome)
MLAGCGDSSDGATGGDAAVAADAGGGEGDPNNRWTSLGGNLSSTFNNTHERVLNRDNARTLEAAWTFDTDAEPAGTPVVVGDRVYFSSARTTYAVEAHTGKEIWKAPVGATASAGYADGRLFVLDQASKLHALDAETGKELWAEVTDPNPYTMGWSSPLPVGDLVVVGNSSGDFSPDYQGSVAAHDAKTGAQKWLSPNTEPPHSGVAMWSSASADPEAGLLYGSTGNNYFGEATDRSDSIFALDLASGELIWNKQLREGDVYSVRGTANKGPDHDFGTNPILFEADIDGTPTKLIGAGQKAGIFWALDRMTGEVVWQQKVSLGHTIGGILNNGASDGERIIAAGWPGRSMGPGSEPDNGKSSSTAVLMAMDHATGEVVWERQLPAQVWGPITVANGVGFVAAWDEMQAFNTETGEKLAVMPTGGTISSGAVVKDGWVYFGSGFPPTGAVGANTVSNKVFHAFKIAD